MTRLARCLCVVALSLMWYHVFLWAAGPERQPRWDVASWGLPEGTPTVEGNRAWAFDGRSRDARWQLQFVTKRVLFGDAERTNRFFADELIPAEFRPTPHDYNGSGFDRGHLAPAGDYGRQADQDRTFSLSNMTPQDPTLNRGLWKRLEAHVRTMMAEESARVWVITAPVFAPKNAIVRIHTIGDQRVWVPTHYVKSVLMLKWQATLPDKLSTWLIPNQSPPDDAELDDYAVSVDQAERECGLDFWQNLPDELEERLESGQGP